MKKSSEPYEKVTFSRKNIIINNFLGGISWALGATLGLSLIIALVSIAAHYVNFIPVIGKFISDVLDFVLKTNSHFTK